jgi:N-acetylglucosaminyldiphosphoundecaprenol N-acetyl-beta-D-mannosaminyltransferase
MNAPSPVVLSNVCISREVYCLLGIPIDAVCLAMVVEAVEKASANQSTLLISTPNLNFLINSLSDEEFRQSVLDSDLCPPDGIALVWIARLLGLPIKERATGADLLEALQARAAGARKLTVFLLGGAKGVADAAAAKLNAKASGLNCVGSFDPGFGDVIELSQDHIIGSVNSSGADFLVVSLGAKKGQLWLQRNHDRLTIPIRAHLGAALNFQAGTIKRAPPLVRAWGLEWLWRIKEENYLWKRYQHDGLAFLSLLITRVLPLVLLNKRYQIRERRRPQALVIQQDYERDLTIKISLSGFAGATYIEKAIRCFDQALALKRNIAIDLAKVTGLDARFLGLLLMLRKELKKQGMTLRLLGPTPAVEQIFRLSGVSYLLS